MLTAERVDFIFKEMNSCVLELAEDPRSLGPQYFQERIAICRNYLNKVSLISSELQQEKLEISGELYRLEAMYNLDRDDKLANDQRVKALASVEDRKATVGYMLREQQKKINELKERLNVVDVVFKVVTHRNRELHATMDAIKDQRRLLQTEISTGAFYGDERRPIVKIREEDALTESELEQLIYDTKTNEDLPIDNKNHSETVEIQPVVPESVSSQKDGIDSDTLPNVDTLDDLLDLLNLS